MSRLTFYTNPMSRGRIARWMLEELVQPYETVLLDYGTTMKAPEYLAVNPMGKVPAVKHGDTVVTEAAAICAYLADAFPDAGLAPPPGDAARGPYYRWMFFAAGPIEAVFTHKGLGYEPPAEKRAMVGYGSADETLAAITRAIEDALAGSGFLAGGRFSAADLYVGAQLGWMLQFGLLPGGTPIATWVGQLHERAAWKRASEIDDALMPKREG